MLVVKALKDESRLGSVWQRQRLWSYSVCGMRHSKFMIVAPSEALHTMNVAVPTYLD